MVSEDGPCGLLQTKAGHPSFPRQDAIRRAEQATSSDATSFCDSTASRHSVQYDVQGKIWPLRPKACLASVSPHQIGGWVVLTPSPTRRIPVELFVLPGCRRPRILRRPRKPLQIHSSIRPNSVEVGLFRPRSYRIAIASCTRLTRRGLSRM